MASVEAAELSPACCQIRIGVDVDMDSKSASWQDVLGAASSLSVLSHFYVMTCLQWDLHLSGLHGFSRYCKGSGKPYSYAVLLTTPDQPANFSSKNARLCVIIFRTYWLLSSHMASWPSSLRISRSRWAVAGRTPILRYTSGDATQSGRAIMFFRTFLYFLNSVLYLGLINWQ